MIEINVRCDVCLIESWVTDPSNYAYKERLMSPVFPFTRDVT